MNKFGYLSRKLLETCHEDIIEIMNLAISRSNVDFGISEGYRSLERQRVLYEQGRSKVDGDVFKGKHNSTPSMAVDIFVYHQDVSLRRKMCYDRVHLSYVAGIVLSCSRELLFNGGISNNIRWGGNWDGDGVIGLDQSFDDFPHFEII